jgi:DNA polymerase-3 subunit epsilon
MNTLLALDVETSGLSFENDRVIELGLAMLDLDSHQVVRLEGFLIKPDIEFTQERWAEAQKIHGISWDLVDKYGMPDLMAYTLFSSWYGLATYIAGHNINLFDIPMLEAWAKRNGDTLAPKVMVDTRTDLPDGKSGRLIHVAAEYGFINPLPHRALSDAWTVLKILELADLDRVIARAMMPNVTVRASVSYDDREKAKARGYYWHADSKTWRKTLKEFEVDDEKRNAGFAVTVV